MNPERLSTRNRRNYDTTGIYFQFAFNIINNKLFILSLNGMRKKIFRIFLYKEENF
jgi:hypothetical protein